MVRTTAVVGLLLFMTVAVPGASGFVLELGDPPNDPVSTLYVHDAEQEGPPVHDRGDLLGVAAEVVGDEIVLAITLDSPFATTCPRETYWDGVEVTYWHGRTEFAAGVYDWCVPGSAYIGGRDEGGAYLRTVNETLAVPYGVRTGQDTTYALRLPVAAHRNGTTDATDLAAWAATSEIRGLQVCCPWVEVSQYDKASWPAV